VDSADLIRQAADLHEYLIKNIGHNWRLSTWEKKYLARLRTYGFDKCIIAVDGFKSLKWWMTNKSQDAPDCIFRSDKSFERFCAAGMALPEHDETYLEQKRKDEELQFKLAEYRATLGKDNAVIAVIARMFKKLEPLKEEINEVSWNVFLAPLLFVKYDRSSKTLTLFSEYASWIEDITLTASGKLSAVMWI